jgi:hypothetical protein
MINKIGIIENGQDVKYLAIIRDEESTGGYYIYTWKEGSNGPNKFNAFDDWVENFEALKSYLIESKYIISWTDKDYLSHLNNNKKSAQQSDASETMT